MNKTYLIVLIDDPENLIKREDGNSFSTDLEKKQLEVDRFVDFFKKSRIGNKIIINIKDKDANQVFEEIKDFLNIVE